ncbi:MAG: hypothetical protein Q4F71_00570 [Paracoccus sp. (in: a-proteobacteria)]|nr:hypothetical protein [Paracoccus sp. (in: a-proteobacteria)]
MATKPPTMRHGATEGPFGPLTPVTARFEVLLNAMDSVIRCEMDLHDLENFWDPACQHWLRASEEAEEALWTHITALRDLAESMTGDRLDHGDTALLKMTAIIDAALGAEDPCELSAILDDMETVDALLRLPGDSRRVRQVNCLLTMAQVKLFVISDVAGHVILPDDDTPFLYPPTAWPDGAGPAGAGPSPI